MTGDVEVCHYPSSAIKGSQLRVVWNTDTKAFYLEFLACKGKKKPVRVTSRNITGEATARAHWGFSRKMKAGLDVYHWTPDNWNRLLKEHHD